MEFSIDIELLSTPEFWPGEFHGLYISWGHKELDMFERLSLYFPVLYSWVVQYPCALGLP